VEVLNARCELLRSLHVPGSPLVLPNAWDAASARAVVAAGFPVVATTSAGVADALGYDDHEAAPVDEMLGAAARIARAVDVPVTVDAEAGYGLAPEAFVDALARVGAAGCNLEDTDHADETLVEPKRRAAGLAAVRAAADARGYRLIVNARIDVFLADRERPQAELVDDAVARANAYLAAGADCVYPIFLHEDEALAAFVGAVDGPVNVLAMQAPPLGRLAELGVARVSYGALLQRRAMQWLAETLDQLPRDA
jgi:2-methylisocitrate lyase-like PEP mutase family enzyme